MDQFLGSTPPVLINPSFSNLEQRSTTRQLRWPKSLECNLKIFGEHGCYFADYFDHTVFVMGEGHASPDRLMVEMVPSAHTEPSMLETFALQVRQGPCSDITATLKDGLAAVTVMNAAYDSLYQQKRISIS